jgi:hypothetical protein
MWASPTPAPTLTWQPDHGGWRGTSQDREREYHVRAVMSGWWSVTMSADPARRSLIRSREGAMLTAATWETEAVQIKRLSGL